MAKSCTCGGDGEGVHVRECKGKAENAHGHDFEAARDRKRDHEADSVRVGHVKAVRACEGDIKMSGYAMTLPSTCAEAIEKPRAPANVLIRQPTYAKDQCTIDCTDGCTSANKDDEEGSRACEQSGKNARASNHHTVERLPGKVESKIQPRAPVDGNSNVYKYAAGCHNGEAVHTHKGIGEVGRVCEHSDEAACASNHHTMTRPSAHAEAIMELRTPVDGHSSGCTAGCAADCGDGYFVCWAADCDDGGALG